MIYLNITVISQDCGLEILTMSIHLSSVASVIMTVVIQAEPR